MNKIFFTDLDGTLLTTDKRILPDTRKALDYWLSHDNILVFSSGRPVDSVKQVIRENNLIHPNVYAIGFNGSVIWHSLSDRMMNKKTISHDLAVTIASLASRYGIYSHSYDDTHILSPGETKELIGYTKTVKIPVKFLQDYPYDLPANPYKVLCINSDNPEKLKELGEIIQKEVGSQVSCVKSHPHLLEVFSCTSGKGQAVTDFAALMNIPVTDTYAAGDEGNDLSMLETAGTSIAMLNGNQELKDIATFVTATDNDHDGLAPFFIQYA